METIRQIGGVAFVLAIALFAAWWLRRAGFSRSAPPLTLGRKSRPRRLETIDRLSLGPHHSLHLVRMGGQALLIGAAPSGCNLLHRAGLGELACDAEGREPAGRELHLQSPGGPQ